MKCDEIQERFVDLLYHEKGTPSADPQLQAHLLACADCRKELAGLRAVQSKLKTWQDEPPLRPTRVPRSEPMRERFQFSLWRMARYAAVAMVVTLAFLGLSNAEIRWDSKGFLFRTSLLSKAAPALQQGYSQEETRAIITRAMSDSQEYTIQMIQRAMESQEQLWMRDLRFVNNKIKDNRGKN
jgi:hypothetical protein